MNLIQFSKRFGYYCAFACVKGFVQVGYAHKHFISIWSKSSDTNLFGWQIVDLSFVTSRKSLDALITSLLRWDRMNVTSTSFEFLQNVRCCRHDCVLWDNTFGFSRCWLLILLLKFVKCKYELKCSSIKFKFSIISNS